MAKKVFIPGHKIAVIHSTLSREPIIAARKSGLNSRNQPELKSQAAIRNPAAREQV
jgi:hypothetical protein